MLASALRAGHSLVGALAVVADDAVEPAKSEFRRVLAEEQFGVQLEDAFQVVVERMENKDLDQVALVARLQREVGSNSAEVLDRVVETVRGADGAPPARPDADRAGPALALGADGPAGRARARSCGRRARATCTRSSTRARDS